MRVLAAALLLLAAACTSRSTAAPDPKPHVTKPAATRSPAPHPTRRTEVLALAALGDQVRLLVRGCTATCHDTYLASTDRGRSFLRPRPVLGPPTEYSGMAVGPGGAVYVWQPGSHNLLWSKDDGGTWATSGPLGVHDVQVRGTSAWAVYSTCQPTCVDRLVGGAVGTEPSTWKPLHLANAPKIVVSRASPTVSFALITTAANGSRLLVTRDAGKTWTSGPAPCPQLGSGTVSAVNGSLVWLLCGGEPSAGMQSKRSYISLDAGAHWKGPFGLPGGGYATNLRAISATRAFASGNRSAILTTSDGGRHWRADTSYQDMFSTIVGLRDGTLLAPASSDSDTPDSSSGSIWRRIPGAQWVRRVIVQA